MDKNCIYFSVPKGPISRFLFGYLRQINCLPTPTAEELISGIVILYANALIKIRYTVKLVRIDENEHVIQITPHEVPAEEEDMFMQAFNTDSLCLISYSHPLREDILWKDISRLFAFSLLARWEESLPTSVG